jgi:hypothetical protein
MNRNRSIAIAIATVALTASAAPAASAAPVAYSGKTAEGSKITFALAGGKITGIETLVPSSCASAQGGTPRVGLDVFEPPGRFALGRAVKRKAEKQDTALSPWEVTKNYTVTTRRAGKRIRGELAVNFSWVDISGPKIFTCLGNASFTAKPR